MGSLVPMVRQLKNRNRSRDPSFRALMWSLTATMMVELIRQGGGDTAAHHQETRPMVDRPPPEGIPLGDSTRRRILSQALEGAQEFNIMDVCQCLQGLAAVNLR